MNKNKVILLFAFLLALSACKTQNQPSELNYMQNVEQIATEAVLKNSVTTIQKGDQLAIFITAKDMTVVKPFNQNYSSAEASQYSTPSTNAPAAQILDKSTAPIYQVDSNGEIDFPVLGKLSATGKTLVDFKDEIRDRVAVFVKNPSVSLKITNYKITVLGEVNNPGQYTVPDGQANVLNALGLAGDLTMYGKRNDILLVRNEEGRILKERINLMDANFINSPFYELKQNDVIYVSANETKEKTARLNPNTGTYIAIAGTIIGLAGIFITIFKK
ncbi:polysaccharide biosynthesis/export family protein [Kaistella faecalis]|uniref:polysaccharide biosynthesis/export family protein n=1 Tax=Kaistella faecalis TaxID=2852098 RepID=UPI001E61BD27|nr:polysaccharide biosynthesis/export family protein [Chryseobacterium faecale]UFK97116.1 polysaccharide biosynthesis/export family protein [Chryseobacterium faecale]